MSDDWKKIFRQIRPFGPEWNWLCTQPTPQQAWDTCPRGDWMLFMFRVAFLKELGSPKHRQSVRAALLCLRTGLDFFAAGPERVEAEGVVDALQAWTEENPLVDLDAVDAWADAFCLRKKSTHLAGCIASGLSYATHAAKYGSLLDAVGDCVGEAAGHEASMHIEDKGACAFAYRDAAKAKLSLLADLIRKEFPTCPLETPHEPAHP